MEHITFAQKFGICATSIALFPFLHKGTQILPAVSLKNKI